MIKIEEQRDPKSCFNKAAHDEPVFVLRAADPLAPAVVSYWAELAQKTGLHEVEKATGADSLAYEMRNWRQRQHLGKALHNG